jgi:tellurite methyltransferase
MPTTSFGWDEKHRQQLGRDEQPSTILAELLPLLPVGAALDLACGTGRNALLLAARQPVTAVDTSTVALDATERLALHRGVPVSRGARIEAAETGLQLVRADLENSEIAAGDFSLIVCIKYLQRSLFRTIARALAPGGMLLFETYTKAQLAFATGPRNPENLLDPGELCAAFPELQTLFCRELRAGSAIASLLARRP